MVATDNYNKDKAVSTVPGPHFPLRHSWNANISDSIPIHNQNILTPSRAPGTELQWQSVTVTFPVLRMHLPSAAVSCSDAKPNTTSLSSYSRRKSSSPITVTTFVCSSTLVSTPPQRRPRSFRLRLHHPPRRKAYLYSSRKLTYQPPADLENPNALIKAPNRDLDTNDAGAHVEVFSAADRGHPIHDGRRRPVSGTHSIPLHARSSARPRLMRPADIGSESQEVDIRKEATSILC